MCCWFGRSLRDLSNAFQQLEVGKESKPILPINTHLGLFQWTRLPYGVGSAPANFQSVMDRVVCHLDDVLIVGQSLDDRKQEVSAVTERLNHYNIKINLAKRQFLCEFVEYLEHEIDKLELHHTERKVQAITKASVPTNITQKFLLTLSSKMKPFHNGIGMNIVNVLLKIAKQMLTGECFLVHYKPCLPVVVACDASPYGVRAVLNHRLGGLDKPVLFASTLSQAELNYSQLDKEPLPIMFVVKLFCKYLYGHKFVLVTDHQSLNRLLGHDEAVPTLANAWLQIWAVILASYDYKLEYRCGSLLANADALSRLPICNSKENLHFRIHIHS
ncbi:hypothetical protein PR048_025512 [Dryococelus australis]|uniref:Reverse transcriptase domain-containing protein n=1 Tax=Dryococelus australis TaxID=614101 RepID=A0ABQ9GRJ0_9NEOP|nr:hypothetical protein PR048_025512 [Dryococelus australis]